MTARQLATFSLDGRLYGIDVAEVLEIMRAQRATPVPLAAANVVGLMSLRGELVTALDLRRCIGATDEGRPEELMNVVVRHRDEVVSLLVDRIGDVVLVDDEAMAPPPETLRGRLADVVLGAYDVAGEILHVLDLDGALAA